MSAKTHHRREHLPAFTLIELLVVVAIIALLISILLPSLSQARKTARMVQCQAVMKQYATGNEMYADSQNSMYVPIRTANPAWQSWTTIALYRQILGVPGKQHASNPMAATGRWPMDMQCADRLSLYRDKQQWGLGYGFNYQNMWTPTNTYDYPMIVPRMKVPIPAMKVQNIESNYWRQPQAGANPVSHWDKYGELMPVEGGVYPTVAYRHIEQVNIQYFDGHVAVATKAEAYPSGSTNRKRLWWLQFK